MTLFTSSFPARFSRTVCLLLCFYSLCAFPMIHTKHGMFLDFGALLKGSEKKASVQVALANNVIVVTISPTDGGPSHGGQFTMTFLDSLVQSLHGSLMPSGLAVNQMLVLIGSLFYTHHLAGVQNLEVTQADVIDNSLWLHLSGSFSNASPASFSVQLTSLHRKRGRHLVQITLWRGRAQLYSHIIEFVQQATKEKKTEKVKYSQPSNIKPKRKQAGVLGCFFGSGVDTLSLPSPSRQSERGRRARNVMTGVEIHFCNELFKENFRYGDIGDTWL